MGVGRRFEGDGDRLGQGCNFEEESIGEMVKR